MNDLTFQRQETNIFNFVDDTAPHAFYLSIVLVLEKLEHNSELAVSLKQYETQDLQIILWAKLDQGLIWESDDIKLLGVTIDKMN